MSPKECRDCGGAGRVTSTRTNGERVYRRRKCELCGNSWSTMELRRTEYNRLIQDWVYLERVKKIAEEAK